MTPEGIAAKVAYGYGKAGLKLGPVHTVYRPTAPTTPALAPQNVLAFISFISSATPKGDFARPSQYGHPIRYGLFDPTQTAAGDYIVGATGTFFVVSEFSLEVPMVVECNATVSVYRGAAATTMDENVYAGRTIATDAAVLNQYPGSVLLGGRSEVTRLNLPGDSSDKGAQILLPFMAGAAVLVQDRLSVVFDQPGEPMRGYTVTAIELTDLGYRLDARVEL